MWPARMHACQPQVLKMLPMEGDDEGQQLFVYGICKRRKCNVEPREFTRGHHAVRASDQRLLTQASSSRVPVTPAAYRCPALPFPGAYCVQNPWRNIQRSCYWVLPCCCCVLISWDAALPLASGARSVRVCVSLHRCSRNARAPMGRMEGGSIMAE